MTSAQTLTGGGLRIPQEAGPSGLPWPRRLRRHQEVAVKRFSLSSQDQTHIQDAPVKANLNPDYDQMRISST